MEWELILIELLVALMVLFVISLCAVSLIWFWWVFCGDLVRDRMRVRKGRNWEDEENG